MRVVELRDLLFTIVDHLNYRVYVCVCKCYF